MIRPRSLRRSAAAPPVVTAARASSMVMCMSRTAKSDAERQRSGVTGSWVAVRGNGDLDAGVDGASSVRIGLAGREIRRRQEGGDGVASGQCLNVVVGQVRAMVNRSTAQLHTELDSGSVTKLVGMET